MRTVPLRIAALAALLVAGACSGGGEVTVPAAAPGARAGGTLRVAITEPSSIDPALAHDPAGRLVVATMCDPLVQLDPRTAELRPAVADSFLQADRGRGITLRIRKDARFSDGSAVTADDVVFSLSRLARADFASPLSGLVRPVTGFPEVHGEEETDDDDARRQLKGLSVIEGNSLEIGLAGELATWVRTLGDTALSVVPRDAAQDDPAAFERNPVCSGPYRLAAPYEPGDGTIVLERTPGHRPVNAGFTAGGAGYADRIEFVVHESAEAGLAAWRAGNVDVAEVPDAALAEVRQGPDAGALLTVPTPLVELVGVPTASGPPFADDVVRQALSLALDRRALAEGVHGGAKAPATGFVPVSAGPALAETTACEATVPAEADRDRARALLADAGVSLQGVPLDFAFNDELGHRAVVEEVARQWGETFGLAVTLRPMAWDTYLAEAVGSDGIGGAFRTSVSDLRGDADAYVGSLFSSPAIGSTNWGRFSDPRFDRIHERGVLRAVDTADRLIEMGRLAVLACQRLPMIPLTHDLDHVVVRSPWRAAEGRAVVLPTGSVSLRELWRPAG